MPENCRKKVLDEGTSLDLNKERYGLFNVIKEFAQSNFARISNNEEFDFNMRIFVPEKSISRYLMLLLRLHKVEKWFVIQNIEPFAKHDITENLKFRVAPNKQGLVGEAYESGYIVYDDILELTNDTDYSLDQVQLNRTSNLKWSLCVPIINENSDVIAVMAFDSDRS